MVFRSIRPSFGDSSASTSAGPNQSTSESTGSDPRSGSSQYNNKDTPESSTAGHAKRRRVPEQVTKNACTNCKKARAKCDGKKPCARCKTRQEPPSDCVYETHIKHAKEELLNQIKELQARDHLVQQILRGLCLDDQGPAILQRLKANESLDSIVDSLTREDREALSPHTSLTSGLENSDTEMTDVRSQPLHRWTNVTNQSPVLDHLFQLYFAWVHPVHTLFSEGHFVKSYQGQTQQNCSSVLVNAMCALACHLHTPDRKDAVDYARLQEAFSIEAREAMDPNDKSLTSIQAFAVMFLVDCAHGNSLRASSYLKIASDNLSFVSTIASEGSAEGLRDTRRGIRCLSIEWAHSTFQPVNPVTFDPLEIFQDNDDALDSAHWYFYRLVDDQCPAWPGLLATTNREKSKLIAIMSDAAEVICGHGGRSIPARTILLLYQRYKNWRESLPNTIGNTEDNDTQVLPHVLSLLILYSTAVTRLLRPLLDLEGFPTELVEDVVWNEAQTGLFLLDVHYRTQYTCQYQPVLQMLGILHLCDVIARFFPERVEGDSSCKGGRQAIAFGMAALKESSNGFPVAGPFQELLRRTAIACDIRLPHTIDDLMATPRYPRPKYRLDDFIGACTRPSYVQPVAEMQRMFDGDFAEDWSSEAPSLGFKAPARSRLHSAETRGAQKLMEIRNLLNTS